MLALGYNEYVTQGGDAKVVITRRIAVDYGKKHNKAWHANMPFKPGKTGPPQAWNSPMLYLWYFVTQYTPAEKAGLERRRWSQKEGTRYHMEQSTQPQTLGYGLADSPAGLLGWIFEKLVNWTDDYPWTDDEAPTRVSIYWFSRAGPAASVRMYYEYVGHGIPDPRTTVPVHVPTGHPYFPKELEVLPRLWLKAPNLVFESQHESGGHFAAHERPEALVGDLRKMLGREGPAFGVVGSHNGFKP